MKILTRYQVQLGKLVTVVGRFLLPVAPGGLPNRKQASLKCPKGERLNIMVSKDKIK